VDKIINQSVSLKCTAKEAFQLFTQNNLLEKWLTVKAEVEPVVGGKYELFWKPDDRENDSTIGCKVLAVKEGSLINFEWKGPEQYKDIMNERRPYTNVTVTFAERGNLTDVQLIHSGWGEGARWDEARDWFEKAWSMAFAELPKVAAQEFPNSSPITGFEFNLVYVDDMPKALAFYEKYFGFKKKFDMDDGSTCGTTGNVGLWIGPNYKRVDVTDNNTRTSVMYGVESAHTLFKQLKTDGVPVVQESPIEMKNGVYWFQFSDPAGNILEVLGAK
jgi:predicted enzyme related to lactoylglutathione lyase/uncharacterized protein YndB with AHSA1/START domain